MTLRTKVLLGGTALYLLTAVSAFANVDVQLNLGAPAPTGVVYERPYPVDYDPHHRNGDYKYWHDRWSERSHPQPAEHFAAHEEHIR